MRMSDSLHGLVAAPEILTFPVIDDCGATGTPGSGIAGAKSW
jgi:hypothetical protein